VTQDTPAAPGTGVHAAPFRVDVHPEREAVRVVPVGELDLATSPLLERELHELRGSGFAHVVLDMRQLTFIDSSGIRVVVAEHRFAERSDRRFSLISGPRAVQRVLELCGMLEHLHLHDA
jgi:anti-sigma B factor antagonist